MKVIAFGDSWAEGAELTDNERPFIEHLAEQLHCPFVNHGAAGNSLGIVLKTVEQYLGSINKDDIVVVIIPPDTRWYCESNGRFKSIGNGLNEREYRRFLKGKTQFWFEYHHILFMYSIQCLLESKKCNFVFAHNYGRLPKIGGFNFPIKKQYFLSDCCLTETLSGINVINIWDNYSTKTDGPIQDLFTGKYFEGKVNHPNDLGHREIARLILEKLGEEVENSSFW